MLRITFADGTKLEGVTLSGNTFYTPSEVNREFFTQQRLRHVVIERLLDDDTPDDETDYSLIGEHDNMKLLACSYAWWAKSYMFVLGKYSAQELRDLQIDGNIAYLAMMTGVDLDE